MRGSSNLAILIEKCPVTLDQSSTPLGPKSWPSFNARFQDWQPELPHIWIGESEVSCSASHLRWRSSLQAARHCDVFVCCRTSSLAQPAASLADIAIDAGAANPTDLDA